jgi:hypothetical protein
MIGVPELLMGVTRLIIHSTWDQLWYKYNINLYYTISLCILINVKVYLFIDLTIPMLTYCSNLIPLGGYLHARTLFVMLSSADDKPSPVQADV